MGNLVLVGGGHAHMSAIANIGRFIDRGHRVTLVSPSAYHYYSSMGPGMLGGFYTPEEIRFPIKKMAQDRGAIFIKDTVLLVHPEGIELYCSSGRSLAYDIVSFNIGSQVPSRIVSRPSSNIFPAKPIENLYQAQRLILDLLQKTIPRIIIIGGGPTGVEISGNVANLVQGKRKAEIRLLAGTRLLAHMPKKAQAIAAASLLSHGVETIEGIGADWVDESHVGLRDGRQFPHDVCFIATGVLPQVLFAESGLPTGEDGSLTVNSFLQNIKNPTPEGPELI